MIGRKLHSGSRRAFLLSCVPLAVAQTFIGCGGGNDHGSDQTNEGGTDSSSGGSQASAGASAGGGGESRTTGGTGSSTTLASGGTVALGSSDIGGGGSTTGSTGTSTEPVRCMGTPTADCTARLCDVMPGCTVSTPAECRGTATPCSAYDDKPADCAAHWGCGAGANGHCDPGEVVCSDAETQVYCRALSGCWWDGFYCSGSIVQACGVSVESTCKFNRACEWTPSEVKYCVGQAKTCPTLKSEVCDRQNGCTLTPALCTGTPTTCDALSNDECLLQPGCKLSSGATRTVVPPAVTSRGADLIMTYCAVGLGTVSGKEVVYYDFEEINRGSAEARIHTNAVVLSRNDVYGDADDFLLEKVDTKAVLLEYGMSSGYVQESAEVPDPALAPPGFYRLICVADYPGTITELEETNNTLMLRPTYIGPKSVDLAMPTASHKLSGTLTPDTSFTITVELENRGSEPVTGASVAVYASADTVLDTADAGATCEPIQKMDLKSGETATYTTTCKVPRARGTFYLIPYAGPSASMSDRDSSNNSATISTQVTIAAPSPDLQLSGLGSDANNYAWQGTVGLSVTATNTGVDPAPATSIAFSLDDKALCTTSVPALAAGQSTPIAQSCDLSSTMLGTLALSAKIDPQDAIFETLETNNTAASATKIVVKAPDLDLSASNVTFTGSSPVGIGKDIGVSFTLFCDGTVDAPPFQMIFYASTDKTITQGDHELCIRNVSGMKAGTSVINGALAGCQVPSIPAGTYYLGFIVDTEFDLPETNERNNTAVDTNNTFVISP
ncbi:MAG: CARDB domain-containing protein [Polyangiaceae bacterium]